MAASNDTVRALLNVLTDHCSPEQVRRIIFDLQGVPGNASFRETIGRLVENHMRDEGDLR